MKSFLYIKQIKGIFQLLQLTQNSSGSFFAQECEQNVFKPEKTEYFM